jgi:hypothetical protein
MSTTTSNATNHLRLDRVAGGGVSVARCGGPGGGGSTGAALLAASWVSWLWKRLAVRWSGCDDGCSGTLGSLRARGTVVASRAARASSTAVAYRWSGFLAIPVAMTSSNAAGICGRR